MSTTYRYVLPVEQTEWKFDGNTETCFCSPRLTSATRDCGLRRAGHLTCG
jgi:hypothetical protein